MQRFISLILIIVCSAQISYSQSLKKSIRCLERGDYFKAMEMISSLYLKDSTDVGVQYALARLYASDDYEFKNYLLANHYIKKAIRKVPLDSAFYDPQKYYKAGIRDIQIKELHFILNHRAFLDAEKTGTISAYRFFVNNYTAPYLITKAKKRRNSLAFKRAKQTYDIDSFQVFIQKYPDADQVEKARNIYELLLYKKITADSTAQAYQRYVDLFPEGPYVKAAKRRYENLTFGKIIVSGDIKSYEEFIRKYPDNSNVAVAEDSIYQISTRTNTPEKLYGFIKKYPKNRNIDKAWLSLFQIETVNDRAEEYSNFLKDYEDYPYLFEVKQRLDEASIKYKPFKKDGYYGYIDTVSGDTLISARYTEASEFSGGLAAVSKEKCEKRCLYGYINKNGTWVIKDKYNFADDFKDGYAVVGRGDCYSDKCKYGMIDKEGKVIIPLQYDEVYNYSGGLALVGDDVIGYGYFDKRGKSILALQYIDATPFSEGKAAVKIDSCWYFINKKGETIWDRCYAGAGVFSEGLAAVKNQKGLWGYIDNSGKWFIEPKYTEAYRFEQGKAKVLISEIDVASNKRVQNLYLIDREGSVVSAIK